MKSHCTYMYMYIFMTLLVIGLCNLVVSPQSVWRYDLTQTKHAHCGGGRGRGRGWKWDLHVSWGFWAFGLCVDSMQYRAVVREGPLLW